LRRNDTLTDGPSTSWRGCTRRGWRLLDGSALHACAALTLSEGRDLPRQTLDTAARARIGHFEKRWILEYRGRAAARGGVLGVDRAAEHIAEAGKKLFGEGTAAAASWLVGWWRARRGT
jgi:hypothetical protein